ncbi:glycosyltransferase family 4 protein [Methyloversatilis discipulorum]|uniref:glycosyltransferase family 4 protein n=1 Tax=Methyloversatilis discipulorum TaxID=1119528 RepID=UPI001A5C7583|nr:glycosyltransferase family 4 protein [Methyloversatilis discipulorum]MBL8467601.1 glycosyltransferase family 4 protein [Methyloversatilis discipulorum]
MSLHSASSTPSPQDLTPADLAAARPLRVLMYSTYFPPEFSGAAQQALMLARQLRRIGHHVEFVTVRWRDLPEHDTVDGFPVTRLYAGRGAKHRELRLWANLCAYVWRRRHEFDVLHSHGAYYTNAIVGPLARAAGLRSIVKASLANDDLHDIGRTLSGRLHRALLRQVDACVAISRDLVREFNECGLPTERIHYLPNGVDTALFHPADASDRQALRAELGLPADVPVALYAGVMDARKNIEWLATQWVRQDAFGTGALLVAVGPQSREDPDGELIGRLNALCRQAPQRFMLRPHSAGVERYLRAADLLVLPSHREGLPNVVLEAMASGLPCVAADVSGTRDLVQHGRTGYTYSPDDAQALALAVSSGLSPAGRALGENGRRIAEEQFSLHSVAQGYSRLYDRLVGAHR